MIVQINSKKKRITLRAGGSDKMVLTLVAGFAGDAIIGNKGFFNKITFGFVDKLVLDMSHPAISKQFIQLIMRMK